MYAVRDRVDLSAFSEAAALPDIKSINVESVLPDSAAEKSLMHNFAILVGRVLKKRMPFFSTFASGLEEHITHVHYKEMSQKSEVVSYYIDNCQYNHVNFLLHQRFL